MSEVEKQLVATVESVRDELCASDADLDAFDALDVWVNVERRWGQPDLARSVEALVTFGGPTVTARWLRSNGDIEVVGSWGAWRATRWGNSDAVTEWCETFIAGMEV